MQLVFCVCVFVFVFFCVFFFKSVCVCVCKQLISVQCSSLRDVFSPLESVRKTKCILKFVCMLKVKALIKLIRYA